MIIDKRAKALVYTNITALIGAILTLIWNAAVLSTEFSAVKREQERQARVQAAIVVEQAQQGVRLTAGEQARILLDGRVMRLEDLQLGPTR